MTETAAATRTTQRARLRPSATSAAVPWHSALAALRALVPRRPLRPWEHERIAELQANRLLELAGINGPATPIELISELPRIRVNKVIDLPVGGTADWVSGRWLLSIAAADLPARQRYTIGHEFKHILDHPLRHVIYQDRPGYSAVDQAERIAEYFAACLLMPKRWIVKAWAGGDQRFSSLSRQFEVSPRAMQVRLWQLALVEPTDRCHGLRRKPEPSTHARRAA